MNPDPIEDYMNSIPIVISNEKAILLKPMTYTPVPMSNTMEANECKAFVFSNSRIGVGRIVFLDSPCSGKFCD